MMNFPAIPSAIRAILLRAFSVLIMLLVISCDRHSTAWPRLVEAEKHLEADFLDVAPLLDSLDASSLTVEDAALYAILKTQYDYKSRLHLTSDSLSLLATDYYGIPHRRDYRAAMAWYSLGCYCTNNGEDERGIDAYLNALHLFPDTLSRYYAFSYQNLGIQYLSHNMFPEALQHFMRFKQHPFCASDSVNVSVADLYIGQTYLFMLMPEEAARHFNAVLDNSYTSQRRERTTYFELAKEKYHLEHDTLTAMNYLNRYLSTGKSPYDSAAGYVLMGDIMHDSRQLDSALYYYNLSLRYTRDMSTRLRASQQLVYLGSQLGDKQLSEQNFALYEALRDTLFYRSEGAKMAKVENEHALALLQQKARSRQNIFLLSLAILLSLVALLLILRRNIRLHSSVRYSDQVAASQLAEIEVMDAHQGDEEAALLTEKRKERMELYRSHFRESKYYHLLMSPSMSSDYMAEFKRIPLTEIVDSIESMCRDFILELRRECPQLTRKDALLCACLMLHLPTLSVMNVEDCTDRALITRKSRVRKKLSDGWSRVLLDPVES